MVNSPSLQGLPGRHRQVMWQLGGLTCLSHRATGRRCSVRAAVQMPVVQRGRREVLLSRQRRGPALPDVCSYEPWASGLWCRAVCRGPQEPERGDPGPPARSQRARLLAQSWGQVLLPWDGRGSLQDGSTE